MTQRWPDKLWLVRHGQSAGNVARDAAHASGADRLTLAGRDVDVPLSDLGVAQARALGHWFAALPVEQRADALLVSPYVRAIRTAELLRESGGVDADEPVCVDERLREKEFGILDGLTRQGVINLVPDQARFREILGKFYHRPPGGESWCDVILRLRSAIEMISREYCAERVLLVSHSVVVLCMRYLLEHMTEEQILTIDRAEEVANCSVTQYSYDDDAYPRGMLRLELFNFVAPLEEAGAPITSKPDAHATTK